MLMSNDEFLSLESLLNANYNFRNSRISRLFACPFAMDRINVRSIYKHKHSHGKRAGRTIMFTAETIFADASRDGPMRRKK